ncbi:hypothetical protein FGO68_gene11516 [Halteria grandinella]|uniref:Uncharacterized protein n=1 Tax=Halteria grandinella TaxID=5974 RepID=A0A8J8SXB5_HALGN|nr:hypothetical protein FGO68_gene11516 [Halteria grandinella]
MATQGSLHLVSSINQAPSLQIVPLSILICTNQIICVNFAWAQICAAPFRKLQQISLTKGGSWNGARF